MPKLNPIPDLKTIGTPLEPQAPKKHQTSVTNATDASSPRFKKRRIQKSQLWIGIDSSDGSRQSCCMQAVEQSLTAK
jgi:hypothetical protein